MKLSRAAIIVGLAVVLAWAVSSLLTGGRETSPQAVQPMRRVTEARREARPAPIRPEAPPVGTSTYPLNPPESVTVGSPPLTGSTHSQGGAPKPALAQVRQRPIGKKEAQKDWLPRIALSLVGADADAEHIWYQAINDPGLPANIRKDLIEDLNEDGFPNPHKVTMDDMPLILSRLQLIEQLAPEAMDDVNAAAFQEAYKDLVNMVASLSQR